MLNSKQRAYLRSQANNIDPIFQIGKGGVTPELVKTLNEALDKRELVKVTILKNCFDDIKEICEKISERTHSDPVQVIGRKIVLFKKSKENPKYL